jgi:hypothetical protein
MGGGEAIVNVTWKMLIFNHHERISHVLDLYEASLVGLTPSLGTAPYVGYNDDLNRNGFSLFTGQYEPGLRRNSRTFFIKMSYLFRRSF